MQFRWLCGKTALLQGLRDTQVRMGGSQNLMAPRWLGNAALSICLPRLITISHVRSRSLYMRPMKETRRLRLCHRLKTLPARRRHRVNLCKMAQNQERLIGHSYSPFLCPSGSLQAGLPCGQDISETTNGDRLAQQLHSPEQKKFHGKPLIPCLRKDLFRQFARHPRHLRAHSLLTTWRRRPHATTLHNTFRRSRRLRQAPMVQNDTHLPLRCHRRRDQELILHQRRLRLGGRHELSRRF